jgi:hypothetical protein
MTIDQRQLPQRSRMLTLVMVGALALSLLFTPHVALTQQPTVAERVDAIKASLAASQAALKKYEWIETTKISLKGEQKAEIVKRCYYGADGGVTKVPVSAPAPSNARGLKGKIAANKKEDLSESMEQAVDLIKGYIPPDPARIQKAKEDGKVSVDILEPGKRARLNFRDYQKPGDTLGVEVDMANNRLLGLSVKSYLKDAAKDAVTMDGKFKQLADGTSYVDVIVLNVTKEKLLVNVDNSGYKKASN